MHKHCWVAVAVCCPFLHVAGAQEFESAAIVRGNLLAPKAFRAAAAKVRPSVVMIETFGGLGSVGGGPRNPGASFKPGEGPSTGLVISPEGHILTSTINFVDQAPVITVVFGDGKRRVAKMLGRDDTRKLCLLKVEDAKDLPTAEIAPQSDLRVGQWAIAMGVGFGDQEPSLSAGIISALNRVSGKAVQTDANLSPANYGGPLIDVDGRVIGICVPLSPGSKEVAAGAEWYDSGIGFAIPLDGLDQLIAALREGKSFKHGYLGIQAGPTPDQTPGAIVIKVLPGSTAEKSALKDGDRILKVHDDEVIDGTHLVVLVNKYVHGDLLKLTVKRGDENLAIDVALGDAPPPPPMPMPPMPEAKKEPAK